MISLIAAIGKNGVIGRGGKIPWHLPADFAYFKNTTTGHPIIMGRTTFESIGKPLPGRTNIVLSSRPFLHEGVIVFQSLPEAIAHAQTLSPEAFVIGGAKVYADAMPLANRLYITHVDGEFPGDTFFPAIDDTIWREVSSETHSEDEKNAYDMRFAVYERRSVS